MGSPAQNPTRRQVREAKHDAMLLRAREYVARLETGLDPTVALRALGAAAVEWHQAEKRAVDGRSTRDQ
jgi:hypothetical protein